MTSSKSVRSVKDDNFDVFAVKFLYSKQVIMYIYGFMQFVKRLLGLEGW